RAHDLCESWQRLAAFVRADRTSSSRGRRRGHTADARPPCWTCTGDHPRSYAPKLVTARGDKAADRGGVRRLPYPRSCFFEQPQFEGLLGNHLLQFLRLTPKLLNLFRRSGSGGIPSKSPLAGL